MTRAAYEAARAEAHERMEHAVAAALEAEFDRVRASVSLQPALPLRWSWDRFNGQRAAAWATFDGARLAAGEAHLGARES